MSERVVLCGANFMSRSIILMKGSRIFRKVSNRNLQILCVLYTEDVGGILTLEYDEEGSLEFQVTAAESDYLFDEIGDVLKIKQYQLEKERTSGGTGIVLSGILSGTDT